jgi:hypothetical protein
MFRFLQQQLTTPVKTNHQPRVVFWLTLSLTFAVIYAYVGGLKLAFADDYIIQDDGRQHVFWMLRFLEPGLFPNDPITDYFQSLAPFGYTSLYKLTASLGINPLTFSKILPLLLGLTATGYCFGVTITFIPIPAAGFLAASLLNQNLWMNDNLASATPRAFVAPFFLMFLYYLIKRSVAGCLIAIALLASFYPSYALVAAGVIVLQLIRWREGSLALSSHREDYWICGAGLVVVFITLLPFALSISDFDPVISLEQAKALPEFYPGGRSTFFWDNPLIYWFWGRGGMFSYTVFLSPLLLFGLLFPILIFFPKRFPLVGQLQPQTIILLHTLITGFSLFFAAHLLLFRLHLPGRYTQYNIPILLAITGAIALTLLLDSLFRWAQNSPWLPKFITLLVTTALTLTVLLYPGVIEAIPQSFYVHGDYEELYQFFAQQPKDTMIASLTDEADNLPTFSQRSVLISREAAIPYHLGYYLPFRQRVLDVLEAQYSPDLTTVQAVNQKYKIDFWLLNHKSFTPELLEAPERESIVDHFESSHKSWLQQYQPLVSQIHQQLLQGQTPALARVADACTVFDDGQYYVLDTRCIDQINDLSS